MFGALRLNAATYEDIEHDKSAIYQALFIVVLVSAATVGGELLSGQDTALWWSILRGAIRGVASWAAWALCTWALGEILFDVVETDADWGQLARTTGFAQIPGILKRARLQIHIRRNYLSRCVCMVVAVRQSLDYTSTQRGDRRDSHCFHTGSYPELHSPGANWRS